MPSPDVRRYVDLTFYDQDSQNIYTEALNYARVALPEFEPREGSIETVIMQAVAIEVAELARTINRLPGGIVEVLLRLYGIDRNDGSAPSTIVRFNAVNDQDYQLPAGVRVFYQQSGDGNPLVLTTDQAIQLTHSKNVSGISVASNVVTVTTSTRHGFSSSQLITIEGVASPDDDLNGDYSITVTSPTTFTYAKTRSNVSLLFSGTVSATPPSTHPSTGFIGATATSVTEEYNGLSSGTQLNLLSVAPQVSSAFLAEPVTGGLLPESDDDYFARSASQFARMSRTLVSAENYIQWAVQNQEFPYIYRATALDSVGYNLTTASGNITLVVAPIDASPTNLLTGVGAAAELSDPSDPDWGQKDEIRLAAEEVSHAGLTVSVVDPLIVSVKVDCIVKPEADVSGATMGNAVTEVLSSFLSPNTWEWESFIRRNQLIGLISNVVDGDGNRLVDYVSSLDISVTGVAPQSFKNTSDVNSFSYSSPTLTVNIGSGAGGVGLIQAGSTCYFAFLVDDEWEVYPIVPADINGSDSVDIPRSSAPTTVTKFLLVGVVDDTTGDLEIEDPAPLVISGAHEVASL